jgi:hypothetical protein
MLRHTGEIWCSRSRLIPDIGKDSAVGGGAQPVSASSNNSGALHNERGVELASAETRRERHHQSG